MMNFRSLKARNLVFLSQLGIWAMNLEYKHIYIQIYTHRHQFRFDFTATRLSKHSEAAVSS